MYQWNEYGFLPLSEKQNNSTLLDILYVLKSLDIEILNNGIVTDTINDPWSWFLNFYFFWEKPVKSKLFQKVCEKILTFTCVNFILLSFINNFVSIGLLRIDSIHLWRSQIWQAFFLNLCQNYSIYIIPMWICHLCSLEGWM